MNGMHGAMLQPKFSTDARPSNPFATRYTRPGVIPPLDRHGVPLDVATLAARFDAVTAAAIEGPHGHGKSTLLFALAATLHAMGKRSLAKGVFRFTGPELVAMNTGMDIHDQQLDTCNIAELEEAIDLVVKHIRHRKARTIA